MDWSEATDLPRSIPHRPTLTSQQSSSLPSTPYQRPRELPYGQRSPSPSQSIHNRSPRSTHSDSNQSLPALRKLPGRCKYETGMAQAKRRVPYSLGPEKLEPVKSTLKEHLTREEDTKLSGDMRELYDRLLPSPESETRRKKLVAKLEKLLNEKWPGHTIKVNVFGSTGNRLGTTDSDVDICITTDLKDLEHVCSLAELLASHGMERVVCVSSAKVPIVKIWDPELRLACDMNVNNPIALENTEMIRAYVGIDDRVRQLAMIIKHWTKRRILNDPALGSTLSSYTWICMIINFLQTRKPPILPCLQQRPNLKPKFMNGIDVTFDKDVNSYLGFGAENKESLGELLFSFFRYYGHEIDFETSVFSVRSGKVIPKTEKGWHLLQNNRLCVEEPFNTSRNLANTADDTSMRGIHLELRRAFKLISEGNLETCCEQYEYPLDEAKTFEKFIPPESRPVVAQFPPPANRGRGGRPGRHSNANNRGPNSSNRRASNSANRVHPSLRNFPYQMSPQELQLHAQQQQFLLHDQLYQQYQYLQAQEQELRLQLQQQALLQGRVAPTASYPHIPFPSYGPLENHSDDSTRVRTDTANQAPSTVPLRQSRFPQATSYLGYTLPRVHTSTTNPPSPLLRPAGQEGQRSSRQASMTDPFPSSSLRAHSQPARPLPSPLSFQVVASDSNEGGDANINGLFQQRRPSVSSSLQDIANSYFNTYGTAFSSTNFVRDRRASEYVGYYVGHSPPIQAGPQISVPSYSGLAIRNGGLSPRLPVQVQNYSIPTTTLPFEQLQTPRTGSISGSADPLGSPRSRPFHQTPSQTKVRTSGPLIVDGSVLTNGVQHETNGDGHEHSTGMTFSASTSEDLAFDTPTSSDDQSQGVPEPLEMDLPPLFPRLNLNPTMNGSSRGETSLGEQGQLAENVKPGQGDSLKMSKKSSKSGKGKLDNRSDSKTPPTEGPFKVSPSMSSIREGPMLSPTTTSQTNQIADGKSEAVSAGKAKAQAKTENPPVRSSEDRSTKDTLSNGISDEKSFTSTPLDIPAAPVPNNGWQTQKRKKHKKGSKSESDLGQSNAIGGEFLPVDESQRKGG